MRGILLFFAGVIFSETVLPAEPPAVAKLRCEYLTNPLGIDATQPRFTWQLDDSRTGAKQTAFQIWVSRDSSNWTQSVWTSGKLPGASNLYTYSGPPIQPFTVYYWKVQVWDREGRALPVSTIARFETGMISRENWRADWISDSHDMHMKPAPLFRKSFTSGKVVRSARVYLAAAGLYELSVNGTRVGTQQLDPAYTRFDRRTLYVTHDVTAMLQRGENVLGVQLGNGWYNHQSTAVWNFHNAPWRGRPAFCLDLRISFTDGTDTVITSGKDWKTSPGPVIFNSIYTGEHIDARLIQPGWDRPGFTDTAWKPVIIRSAPAPLVASQVMHPIRPSAELVPVAMRRLNDTLVVYDLGKNISGTSRLRVKGPAGTIIRLKHGEQLYPDGRVDQSNIDVHYRPHDKSDPFQTDIYILAGKAAGEIFEPRFNYKGFQYVEVSSSQPVELQKESLRGFFLHSDVPVAGNISTSNPLINGIWQATNQSYLSNLFGYPTDCPQREKNGWTGDAHIAVETGLYNFDGITVYEKWMADHRDEQQPNGVLPSIVPTGGWGYEWGNGPDWTSTIALIPWNIYLFYGDKKPLADCYTNIKRYVDHIEEISPSGITNWGLGDWVPVRSKTPVELTSTAYYYADALILSKAAGLLGKKRDQQYYLELSEKIRSAFNARFLQPGTAIYGEGNQTAMSVPLYWGLVPDSLRQKVADQLAARVARDGYHLDVGLLGTKAILNALSENGHADIAYRIAAQEDFPSWGWWIRNGATSLYENWSIDARSDLSRNHIMFGEIGAWFYKCLGGIRPDEQAPGFRHVVLRPAFPAGLNSFEAEYESVQGKIISSWKRVNGKIQYHVTIPANTSATLSFPRNAGSFQQQGAPGKLSGEIRLEAGTYYFQSV